MTKHNTNRIPKPNSSYSNRVNPLCDIWPFTSEAVSVTQESPAMYTLILPVKINFITLETFVRDNAEKGTGILPRFPGLSYEFLSIGKMTKEIKSHQGIINFTYTCNKQNLITFYDGVKNNTGLCFTAPGHLWKYKSSHYMSSFIIRTSGADCREIEP